MKSLNELMNIEYEHAKKVGWSLDNTPERIGICLLLAISEISEATESLRKGEPDFFEGSPTTDGGPGKPEGFGIEIADAILLLLFICKVRGIDIENLILRKLEFNKTRPFRHGGKVF